MLWTKDFINISFINLTMFFGFSMMTPTLPLYIKRIGGNDTQVGIVMAIYTIAALIARPTAGVVINRVGRKKILLTGLIIITICIAMYSLCNLIWLIALLQFINGFGFGLATTSGATIATDLIPHSRIGEGMGFFALTNCVGMALAPFIGLAIMNSLGFSSMTLFASGSIGISIFIAFFIKHKEEILKLKFRNDFSAYEKTAFRPAIIIVFVVIVIGSVNSFVPIHASSAGIKNIGLFFMFLSGALLITRPTIGKLTDHLGYDKLIFPGFALLVIGMVILSNALSLPTFLVSGALIGIGYGATQTCLQTMAVVNAPFERRSAANATFFTGIDAGMGLGAFSAGVIASAWGYKIMYLSLITFILAGAVIFFVTTRRPVNVNVSE